MNGEQKVLMEKMITVLLNKQDVLEDAEVISEYKTQFLQHAQSYLKNTFGIQVEKDEMPVYTTSAITRE